MKINSTENFSFESRLSSKTNSSLSFEDFLCLKLFDQYIRNIPQELRLCTESVEVCDYGVTLVARDIIPRLPNECLTCSQGMAFGEREVFNRTLDETEVLFLFGCVLSEKLKNSSNRLSNALRKEFNRKSIEVKFRSFVATSEGHYQQFWPKAERKLNFRRLPEDVGNGSHSFDFLFVTSPVSRPLSRHVIAIECQPMSEKSLDFVSARNHFL